MRKTLRYFLMAYVVCLILGLISAWIFETHLHDPKSIIKQAAMLFFLYLSGSIPFGLLFAKALAKTDVRTIGSGNIGTTNVLRTGNKAAAAMTLLFDTLKGLIPLLILQETGLHPFPEPVFLLAFLMPVLGHMYPCWLNFKGGKGIATGLGVLLVFCWPLALICLVLWIGIAKVFKMSSLAGLIAFGVAPILGLAFKPWSDLIWVLLLSTLVFWAHRDNIKRLLNGQEIKFGETTP